MKAPSINTNSLWFIISITLNALGNSFMVISNLGSAPWTSAAENLVYILPFSIGGCIIIVYSLSFVLSYLVKIKPGAGLIVKSMGLAAVFGVFIDLFLNVHQLVYVPDAMWSRYLYLFIGLNLVAIAVCIYFQSSSVYLPSDYLLKAFGQVFNNYTVASILATAIPISVGTIIIIFRNEVVGIGPGTLLFVFGMGFLIDQYNRWIVIRKPSYNF